MLEENKNQIPSPSRQDLIDMTMKTMNELDLDISRAFKSLFVTNKLDGSEDLLIGDTLRCLVYEEMKEFRKKLVTTTPPNNIQDLVKTLTPPKGVKRKCSEVEGGECFDHNDEGPEPDISELWKKFKDMDEEDKARPSDAFVNHDELQDNQNAKRSSLKYLPLSGISEDPIDEKDAIFMDKLSEVLSGSDGTSTLFMPDLLNLQALLKRARRKLVTRIERSRAKQNQVSEGSSIYDVTQIFYFYFFSHCNPKYDLKITQ